MEKGVIFEYLSDRPVLGDAALTVDDAAKGKVFRPSWYTRRRPGCNPALCARPGHKALLVLCNICRMAP